MPQAASPAPASGPGQLARRTDGGPAQKLMALPDAKYGENATYQADQRGAPLAQSPTPQAPPGGAMGGGVAPTPVTPFSAATERPGEPVTAGAALGAGPGTEALGIHPQQVEGQDMNNLGQYLPVLRFVANLPNASPGARMMVNLLDANQGPSGPTQGPGAPQIPMGGPAA